MSNPFLEDVIKTVDFKEGFGFRYSLSVDEFVKSPWTGHCEEPRPAG